MHASFAYTEIWAKWIELTTPGKSPRYKRHFDTKFGQVWLHDSVCSIILMHLLVHFLCFCIFCIPTCTYARPFYRCIRNPIMFWTLPVVGNWEQIQILIFVHQQTLKLKLELVMKMKSDYNWASLLQCFLLHMTWIVLTHSIIDQFSYM